MVVLQLGRVPHARADERVGDGVLVGVVVLHVRQVPSLPLLHGERNSKEMSKINENGIARGRAEWEESGGVW